jgi:hypothetical protein
MMKKSTTWIAALLFSVLMLPPVQRAYGQVERHVVTIEEGQVYIDGNLVPEKELPSSLDIKNLSASMNFTGDALLELNGKVFQLKDGRLVEADDNTARDGRMMVFFRNPDGGNSVVRVLSRRDDDGAFGRYRVQDRPHGMVMENYLDALEDKAREFEVIRGQLTEEDASQAQALAGKLRLEAENAARIAKALPRVEFESYLEGIQQTDQSLYNQLIQEHSIEVETQRLALEARAANTQERREELVEALRKRLEDAFELKQKNREREIEQLDAKLSELRQRIQERSDARERIIDARLKELLGEINW